MPIESLSASAPNLEVLIQLGFYLIIALYAVFSIVLYYHWNEYSVSATISKITSILYLGLTLPLIGTLSLLTLTLTS